MSDLLAIRDFNSAEFVDRIRGIFNHCAGLAERAATLSDQTKARVEGMRRHTFDGLAEIGEALLRVQEDRPGEFEEWFAAHEGNLGFSMRHAERCKAAARLVRERGLDQAYALSLEAAAKDGPTPIVSLSLRLTRPLEALDADERARLRERLEPIIAIHHRLGEIDAQDLDVTSLESTPRAVTAGG